MKSFEAILRLKGFPVSEAKENLTHIQTMDAVTFNKYQEKSLEEILNHHIARNKNYRNFIGNKTPEEWRKIPILTKQVIQRQSSDLLSGGYNSRNVYLNNTSGSSGHPLYFAKDKFAHAMTWSLILDRYSRHDIDINHSLQARFFGIPLTSKGYLKEKIKDRLSNRVRFPVFDLSDHVLGKYLTIFERRPFEYLNGYSSSLTIFAKYILRHGLKLKDRCPTLKVCITTSEICTAEDRAIMEMAFGVRVVNEYGAAELDLIAFEDESFDWIMSNENLYFEVVDNNNNPVEEGVEGKLLVTALFNKAMPFIRYELGDVVVIEKEKKGNNQLLKSLIGRTNDYAILPSGKKSAGLTFYYISKSLLEEGGFMKEFVVKQLNQRLFRFEYVSDNELSSSQKNKVHEAVELYLEPGLDCEFVRKDHIDRTKAGKLKHFERLFE